MLPLHASFLDKKPAGSMGRSNAAPPAEADTVRFNLINPQTNNRIKIKTVDAGTGEELSRSDLVKGFAIAKNQYVLLDKEDFEYVKLESTRIIAIESFVPAASMIVFTGTPPITWCPRARPALKPSP